MSDITFTSTLGTVERLRAAARTGDLPLGVSFDCLAVADEIERLRDQIAMLMVERDKWKQCAHAYERGAMSLGDRLIKEASRG